MKCPLCGEPLRGRGPAMHSIWMEMESDCEAAVIIHTACAWDAVRAVLYYRDGDTESNNLKPYPDLEADWIGWEPMDQHSPYEAAS